MFDLGGVFIDWDPRHLYRKLFGGDEQAMELFLATVCTPEWHAQQDLGKPVAEACAELAARYPGQAALVWAWAERNEEMVGGVLEGSVQVLTDLKAAGVPCYALSNMEREAWERRLGLYDFLRAFDGYVISSLVGLAKPDPRIFALAIEKFSLEPERTLFVDDRQANVDVAAALGFQALVFRSPEGLREELGRAGLALAGT